jgi:hypothetical protein
MQWQKRIPFSQHIMTQIGSKVGLSSILLMRKTNFLLPGRFSPEETLELPGE